MSRILNEHEEHRELIAQLKQGIEARDATIVQLREEIEARGASIQGLAAELKKLLADAMLDNAAQKDLLAKKW